LITGEHAHVVAGDPVHPPAASPAPRKMLPPPTTSAISAPACWASITSRARRLITSGSIP
jgi:hypothetical protein